MPVDDPEIQQEEQPLVGAGRSVVRCRAVAKACAATLGIAFAIAGAGLLTGHMAHRLAAHRAAGVEDAIGEAALVHLGSQKCHWIKLPQHDFPDRGDTGSTTYTTATKIEDLQHLAEQQGHAGFAVRPEEGSVYFKGGQDGPRSWGDLLWMGDEYQVDFYFCEKTSDLRESEQRAEKALEVIHSYAKENTASIADQWVSVHALPKNEGTGMGLEGDHTVETVEDMKILCGFNPDCAGFAYHPKTKKFLSKKKYTGFVADDARYGKNVGWEWHYIRSRGQEEEAPIQAEAEASWAADLDNFMNVKKK